MWCVRGVSVHSVCVCVRVCECTYSMCWYACVDMDPAFLSLQELPTIELVGLCREWEVSGAERERQAAF